MRAGRMNNIKRERRTRALIARDGNWCHYCRRAFTEDNFKTLDHVEPWSVGGSNDIHNLVLACYSCNHTRGDSDYKEFFFSNGYQRIIV